MDADVIVVGAGVAGGSAACHLAAAGRRVLVLEQAQQWPRGHPCGGGMAASVQRWFPFDLSPAVDRVIRRVRFSWCLDDPVLAELPGDAPFWIVRRAVLDAFLQDQASKAGAEFRSGQPVESLRRQGPHWEVALGSGRSLSCRAVVIAAGSGSPLPQSLGLGPSHPRFASTLSVEVDAEVSEPDAVRFDFGLVHHGFCWAFPRQGGYSIGLGTFVGRQEADAEAVLTRLLPALGLPPQAGLRTPRRLRLWSGHHRLQADGAVVVGDAASLCDPFLAEGLRPALLSGRLAAIALDRWLGGDGGALAQYDQGIRQQWGESMAWGKRIAQVFYRLPRVGYQLGVKRHTAPQRIAQILSGQMGYGDIAQRVIRRLLLQGN